MKSNHEILTPFEMIIESDTSILIKKVYPKHLSAEEIQKEEAHVPRVILRCFDKEKVLELQACGEKIAKELLEIEPTSKRRSPSIKSILASIKF